MNLPGDRLQKLLAASGLGSRREIEGWIAAGRVTVNGKVAELGQRVESLEAVAIDGKPLRRQKLVAPPPRVIVYNKPEGEICSRKDPEGRPSVFEQFPRLRDGRWVLVGRLDLNTAGLLLATDHGELANRLMHPGYGIEREYLVRVNGEVDDAALARLRTGVQLDDGMAAFDTVEERGGSGRNRWFSVVLREGRNREVRRLWEAEGLTVSRLKRVRFGPVFLGPRDLRGAWRDLDEAGVRQLFALVELNMPAVVPEGKQAEGSPKRSRSPREGSSRSRSPREGAARPRSRR
jgi:23S rRNA pseudouridine2605 synthase